MMMGENRLACADPTQDAGVPWRHLLRKRIKRFRETYLDNQGGGLASQQARPISIARHEHWLLAQEVHGSHATIHAACRHGALSGHTVSD
jgi:hypothetical protein